MPDVGPFSAPWRCAAVGRDRSAQVLDRGRGAGTDGGKPEVCRIETTEKAIRRFIENLGGPAGLSVCYEAGPGGFALWRLLTKLGVACDVVAPSLIPVRAGDRVITDRRDAKKLVSLYARAWCGSCTPRPRSSRGSGICCARVMTCGARGWRPATGCSSSCCVTAGSSARARGLDEAAPCLARTAAPR
jgi:hypothetical protein